MSDFKKSYPLGRSIAVLFSNIGWGIAAIGLLLAIVGFVLGATPGSGGATGDVSLTTRIAASALGLAVLAFGLMSLLLAVQSRAAMDTADMTREMLKLARKRPERQIVSRSTNNFAEPVRDAVVPLAPRPRDEVQEDAPDEAPDDDDVPSMPVHLKTRLSAPAPTEAPRVAQPAPKPASRSEPRLNLASKSDGAAPRAHPIFSAKPPR